MNSRFSLVSLVIVSLGCQPAKLTEDTSDALNADTDADTDTDTDADTDTDTDTDADTDADADADTDADADADADDTSAPFEDCADARVVALDWFDIDASGELEGTISYGQTHVIQEYEDRWAPPLIEDRAALLLFDFESDTGFTDMRLGAWDGDTLLGVLPMATPADLPSISEQVLTTTPLNPWSTTSYSAMLPWNWVHEGVELVIGVNTADGLSTHSHTLTDLGAPQRFTVSRSKMVLFGEPDKSTAGLSAEQLGRDFFASYPSSNMQWIDSAPWRLDEIVVNTDDGPTAVSTEGERLALTSDPDRWQIIKHQFAIRMSLANTGRGLAMTGGGDSSPYSFGTSVGSGWVRNDDGTYSDLDNAPYAAGWTGWTAIWLGECSNAFIHELGHSSTLLHFTGGTAASWGIGDEYTSDGTNLPTHPWGFDTTTGKFRTWYRVNSAGPAVREDGSWQGKNDPMNGGEGANAVSCYPQFTGYHAWKIQNWSQSSATIRNVDDVPGIYTWDSTTRTYASTPPTEAGAMTPTAVDVPVVTLIGAFGRNGADARIYTPIYWGSGNVFAYPEATEPGLDGPYEGARYYLKVSFEDGSESRMLIAARDIADTDNSMYLFSVNVPATPAPTSAALYTTLDGYPEMDFSTPFLLHAIDIDPPTDPIPEPVWMGRGFLANGALSLSNTCEPGFNCDSRSAETNWRWSDVNLHFTTPDGRFDTLTECSAADSFSVLNIPVTSAVGERADLVVHAQRTVQAGAHNWAGPINDVTPWVDRPNLSQGLRVWVPHAENADLPAGVWTLDGPFTLSAVADGATIAKVELKINLQTYEAETLDLNTAAYEGPSYTADASSSSYFVLTDATVGPTGGIWWGNSDATPLNVPIVDTATGEHTTLNVDAWKRSCSMGWSTWWNLNSAQSASTSCAQWVTMVLGDNSHLISGHNYRSPASAPVVIRAVGWHAGGELGRDAFIFNHTAP